MPVAPRVAVLLDGEFVRKVLRRVLSREPRGQDVVDLVEAIRRTEPCRGLVLYRAFYYSAEPLAGRARRPLDGLEIEFGGTEVGKAGRTLLQDLEGAPWFAVRRGTLALQGWQIGRRATRALQRGLKAGLEARDIVPRVQQKGVDMRIGLDIATMALKRLVDAIVVVTGDSDLVPALKLARAEGLQVFLDTLGRGSTRQELRIHADVILSSLEVTRPG